MKCKMCEEEFDKKESIRVYGFIPSNHGTCSARCYTASLMEKRKPPEIGDENDYSYGM